MNTELARLVVAFFRENRRVERDKDLCSETSRSLVTRASLSCLNVLIWFGSLVFQRNKCCNVSEIRHRLPSRSKPFFFYVSHFSSSTRERQKWNDANRYLIIQQIYFTDIWVRQARSATECNQERGRRETVTRILRRSERVRFIHRDMARYQRDWCISARNSVIWYLSILQQHLCSS